MEADALAMSQAYLGGLHKLGRLTERLDWMTERLAELVVGLAPRATRSDVSDRADGWILGEAAPRGLR